MVCIVPHPHQVYCFLKVNHFAVPFRPYCHRSAANYKTMKYILITIYLIQCISLFGQRDSVLFDKRFIFRDGIYTSNEEVLSNEPKYPNYILDPQGVMLYNSIQFYYYIKDQDKKVFPDSILGYAKDGIFYVLYKLQFYKLFNIGSISTFLFEVTSNYYPEVYITNEKVGFFDLKTGLIDKVSIAKIDDLLKRDIELYSTFSKISLFDKKKALYPYILKYNMRNLIYIKK
jgi:hypothetical protein